MLSRILLRHRIVAVSPSLVPRSSCPRPGTETERNTTWCHCMCSGMRQVGVVPGIFFNGLNLITWVILLDSICILPTVGLLGKERNFI